MNKVVAFKKTLDHFLNDHRHFVFSLWKKKKKNPARLGKKGEVN